MNRETWIGAGIVLIALIAVGVFMYSRSASKEKKRAEQRKRGPIEHAQCDPHRLEIARLEAEIPLIQSDPLRVGNARGELARSKALLGECERQANRDEAA